MWMQTDYVGYQERVHTSRCKTRCNGYSLPSFAIFYFGKSSSKPTLINGAPLQGGQGWDPGPSITWESYWQHGFWLWRSGMGQIAGSVLRFCLRWCRFYSSVLSLNSERLNYHIGKTLLSCGSSPCTYSLILNSLHTQALESSCQVSFYLDIPPWWSNPTWQMSPHLPHKSKISAHPLLFRLPG